MVAGHLMKLATVLGEPHPEPPLLVEDVPHVHAAGHQRPLQICYPSRMTQATTTQRKLAAIPAGVWALGFVSMLMDISSEMIRALLPLYLVVALGASALTVGIIEGIAEATALVTK